MAAVAEADPGERLRRQLSLITERLQRDQGLLDAVGDRLALAHELAPLRRALREAVRPSLRAAQQAGTVRADVSVVDVVTLAGSLARPGRTSEGHVGRHVGIALDGLAATSSRPLPAEPRPPRG